MESWRVYNALVEGIFMKKSRSLAVLRDRESQMHKVYVDAKETFYEDCDVVPRTQFLRVIES